MRAILLTVKPFDPSLEFQVAGLPGVLACMPTPESLYFDSVGGERQVYLSDIGYITSPNDVPANTIFEGRLSPAYDWSVTLFDGGEPTGEARTAFGQININNQDGEFDYLIDMPFDGRDVDLKYGETDDAFADFETALIGTIDQIEWGTQQIQLRLRDPGEAFRLPVRRNRYTGAGDENGDTDLAGTGRPLAYGRVRNVTPVLVSAADLLYQVHDGGLDDIDAVRDKGIALVDAGNFTTVALLLAATTGIGQTIEPGEYATCLAEGYFRLGGQPDGLITCDATGDNSGGYIDDTANIIRRLATTRLAPYNLQDPEQIDTASFTALISSQPATVGFYVDTTEITMADIATRLMAGIGGYWYFNRERQLVVGRLELATSPAVTLTLADIITINRAAIPTPVWRRAVTWRKSWTVQGADNLAAGVSDADRQLYGFEYRQSVTEDGQTRGRHRFARDVQTVTYFDEEADATAEAERLEALHHVKRDRYQIELRDQMFTLYPGQEVTIEYPRFGMDAGVDMVIVSMSESSQDGRTTIEVWG